MSKKGPATDDELIAMAHDLYKRLGGIGSKDARIVRTLWERWQVSRKPGPATRKLVERLLEYRRAPDFEGCTSVAIWTDGPTARAFLAEWRDSRP